ncbi:MAG: sodium:proton antiporter [Candidatus Gracilibacteria bacterium]|nr:sodium:proton antiporter [Candidatus Gracilibacteria bacterium]
MEVTFLSATLSLFFLLAMSVFTYILSKKINFPYTVLLLIVGLILIPLSKIELFSFINHFDLTPNVLFYVFLPILIFESAYNMNYRQILKNWKSISGLAIFGLLISAIIIGLLMYFIFPLIGFKIPFLVCLLFGSLISATDPVAVLSIFKSIGAPRRLTLIFEGESLFNDGTSLALFLVVLGIILSGEMNIWTYVEGFGSFSSMMIGGIIFGSITGVLFSKIIGKIRNNEMAEITLTMILAHLTFILSEVISEHINIFGFELKISGVIATSIAGIIIGNYGRYKISPKVEAHMNQFWEFFAFIANSLVFILMGLILSHIEVNFNSFIIPIFIVIIIVILARAVSVYIPIYVINKLKMEENIPKNWQHLLSWGSLRGALALMMVLMVPGVGDKNYDKIQAFQNSVGWNFDFGIKDFLIVITIGSIMFTLFIKATTIGVMMRKLGATKLHELEEFEHQEGKILAHLKMLEKLDNLYKKNYLTINEVNNLRLKYEDELKIAIEYLKEFINLKGKDNGNELIVKALSLHALGIEKQYLKDLFTYNEIGEKNFKYIFNKINRQIERLEGGKPQLKDIVGEKTQYDIFQKIVNYFSGYENTFIDNYVINRTKAIITRKVIKELKHLSTIDFGFDKKKFDSIIDLYENFNIIANEKKDIIFQKHKSEISIVEGRLADKSLLKLEENVIKDLFSKEIITPKLYIKFMEEIEEGILKDVKII